VKRTSGTIEQLDDVADADHEHDHDDRRLERAEAEPLQAEDQEGCDRGHECRRQQPHSDQQVEADRRPQELGEVGGDCDQLRLHPEGERDASRQLVAAHFGEVAAGGDAELGGQPLHEHRHQVRGDDHPDECVAVA
jgi:hypothetical protein